MGTVVTWGLLWIMLLALSLANYWVNAPQEFKLSTESFLLTYSGTLTGIGTLFLISVLAIITTLLANKSANQRDRTTRQLQAELAVSQFRQKWMDELRVDLAYYLSRIGSPLNGDDVGTTSDTLSRILLRLNHDDPVDKKLIESLMDAWIAQTAYDKDAIRPHIVQGYILGRKLLKREWMRVVADLKNAQFDEDSL
jgi:hypothetical protein